MAAKKKRSPYYLAEPNWAEFSLADTVEKKEEAWKKSRYFIHAEINNKETYKSFRNWIKKGSKWTKAEQKIVLGCPDYCFLSIGEYAWFWEKTGYMLEGQENYIYGKYDYFKQKSEEKAAEKAQAAEQRKAVVKPIRRELEVMISAVDESIDNLMTGKKAGTPVQLTTTCKLNKEESNAVYEEYANILDEFKECQRVRKIKNRSDWDDQLVEGYSHVNKPNMDKLVLWLDEFLQIMIAQQQRKTPIRRKKPQDPRKIVARLRYLQADKDLNIASVNPTTILGSTEVWVYDTKRRRLGLYMSKNDGGLHVKGTSITGYDEGLSYEKTLRKPEEQLKVIMSKSKKAIHEVVGKIRGKQMKVKTRINPNMLLLKVQ